MARTTKQLSGGGKDKFLRGLIAEAKLPAQAASNLADAMCEAIADIRVRREAWDAKRQGIDAGVAEPSPAAVQTEAASKDATPTATPAFDPYVFSALAVLAKNGRAALVEHLAAIDSVTDLKALAKAQHLTLDASLSELQAVRTALVTATEARLAERRAAAS